MDDAIDAWSPDGKKIAFASELDDQKDIFVVNVDGSGLTRLTTARILGGTLTGHRMGTGSPFCRPGMARRMST